MNIGDSKWIETVITGASELGVFINETQADMMAGHCRTLVQWNKITNLTAITDPYEIAVKHATDSLAPLSIIQKGARIIDIGTGGGFPGIPLKMAEESLDITLLDSSRKKVSFLKQVIMENRLKGIKAVHSRGEDLPSEPGMSEGFDIVICRAFSDLETIYSMAMPLLKKNGKILAMKGKDAVNEAEKFRKDHDVDMKIKMYRLPFLNQERALIGISGGLITDACS